MYKINNRKVISFFISFMLFLPSRLIYPREIFYLAPPGSANLLGLLDEEELPSREEISLTSEDIEEVMIRMLERLDDKKGGKYRCWYCIPQNDKQASIAMNLGFTTPLSPKDADTLQELEYAPVISLKEAADILVAEIKDERSRDALYTSFLESGRIALPYKQKKDNPLCVIPYDIDFKRSLLNAISRNDAHAISNIIKYYSITGTVMVLQDKNSVNHLAQKLGDPGVYEMIYPVDQEYACVQALQAKNNLKRKTQEIDSFIQHINDFVKQQSGSRDEEALVNCITSGQELIKVYDELKKMHTETILRHGWLIEKFSLAGQLQQKVRNTIIHAVIELAQIKFDKGDVTQAEGLLTKYFDKKTKDKRVIELFERIHQIKKDTHKAQQDEQYKQDVAEVRSLMHPGSWDMAYGHTVQLNNKYQTTQYAKAWQDLINEVAAAAQADVCYWISPEKRKQLIALKCRYKNLNTEINELIENMSFLADIIEQHDVSRKRQVSILVNKKREQLRVVAQFKEIIVSCGHTIWLCINTEAQKFITSKETTFPCTMEDFVKVLDIYTKTQYKSKENTKEHAKAEDILIKYLQAVEELYDTDDFLYGVIRLAHINGEREQNDELIKYSTDRPEIMLLKAGIDFNKSHEENYPFQYAEKEAKYFIALLLKPEYKDILAQVRMACLQSGALKDTKAVRTYQNTKTIFHALEEIIKEVRMNPIDYNDGLLIHRIVKIILVERLHNKTKDTTAEDLFYLDITHAVKEELTVWFDDEYGVISMQTTHRLWHGMIDLFERIIVSIWNNKKFNRIPMNINDKGRTEDPYQLILLPAMGYPPLIDPKSFADMFIEHKDAYASSYVLSTDKNNPPELVITLNAENDWLFTINHLQSAEQITDEAGKLRVFLFENNELITDRSPYEALQKQLESHDVSQLAGLINSGKAKIVVEHILTDAEKFLTAFFKNPLKINIISKQTSIVKQFEEKIRQSVLKKTYHAYEVIKKPKDIVGFDVALIEKADTALSGKNLKSMKSALLALQEYFCSNERNVTEELMERNTKQMPEAYTKWLLLRKAIEEEEKPLVQQRAHFAEARKLMRNHQFDAARQEIREAAQAGASMRSAATMRLTVNYEEKMYLRYLAMHEQLVDIQNQAESADENTAVEIIEALQEQLNALQFDSIKRYKDTLAKEKKMIQDKLRNIVANKDDMKIMPKQRGSEKESTTHKNEEFKDTGYKEPPKTIAVKHEKDLTKFDRELIEEILKITHITKSEFLTLAHDLLIHRILSNEDNLEDLFKQAGALQAKNALPAEFDVVITAVFNLKNPLFVEMREMYEMLVGENVDFDVLLKIFMIAKITNNQPSEQKTRDLILKILSEKKGISVRLAKDYKDFLNWQTDAKPHTPAASAQPMNIGKSQTMPATSP